MTRMADEQTGGMIALIPRESDAAALAVSRGEKPEEMHLTLTYLGSDVTGMDSRQRNAIAAAAAGVAVMLPPVETRVFGHATFAPGEPKECAVYLVGDSTVLGPLRAELAQFGGDDQHEPFMPHITAGYGVKQSKLTFTGPVVFDRLRVALAGDHYDFPLGEPMQKGMHMVDHIEHKRRRTRPAVTLIPTVAMLRQAIANHDPAAPDSAEHKVLVIRSAEELDAVNLLPEVWTKAVADDLALHSSEETIGEWVSFEAKVMSPNPNAAKLREYWVGQFGKKWRKFRQLRRHLAKYVQNPKILNGLTANIYKLATGTWPGRRGGEKAMPVITAEEFKAAMLMADPDADFDLMADDYGSLAPEDDEDELDAEGDASDEETAYEQALADDFIWSINADGELERDDDAPVDDVEAEDDVVPPGPRSVGEAYSLF
jgi:2'-5' RNA ligase